MFKEIKKQITIFNVLTLIAFLFLLIIIILFLIRFSLDYTGETYLKNKANEIASQPVGLDDNSKTSLSSVTTDYEYIKWGPNKRTIGIKIGIGHEGLLSKGYEYLEEKLPNDSYRIFSMDGITFRVYTMEYIQGYQVCQLQVYQNITTEISVMPTIISFLLLIGIAGILILIPISYFLAGKSLLPIKEAMDDQKKFIADASHELRTPLTVIQTNVEVLRLKEDEVLSENIKWLNNIDNEGETMSKLISELLLIAQADGSRLAFDKQIFNLSALCAEIIDLMYDLAKDKNILLKGEILDGIDIYGDEERVKQAIRIFVDNAIKYTNSGGEIVLSLSENKKSVSISVKDNGIGLTEEASKKIFSRFYRVDDARNRETGGVGLGLNIADMIVKEHNGKIKIDSKIDVGSTFTIILPKVN